MLRKALLRTAIATLLVASAAQAQTLDQTLSGCNGVAPTRTIQATPSNYRSLIAGLLPGDRLQLAAGTYTQGLPLHNKNGEPGQCIVIEGPASGSPALFTGSDSWNLVSLKDSSYITLRNLSLDGLGKAGDGIKAEATAVSVHHILIEGLSLRNFNQNQQIVGISTKCPAWNWVVRRTTITSTGTGMYFGDSTGEIEFANSLIEHNLVHGTLGYNAQFKHQLGRDTSIGIPSTGTTIIRHNTFSKEAGSASGSNARPNLLVGHWPLSGAGSSDIYQIYGNLFYLNPYESLFQGEGNLALHDNLFVTRTGSAVRIQAQNSVPRRIEAFNNTVVATGTGISITGADPAYPQRVVGNAVFAGTPLTGGQQSNNVLQNGVPVSGISGAQGSQQFWTISVPSGASNLQFQTSGGTGDADLYVRFGSAPTTATYDCGPVTSDNNETCSFPSPAAGTWHVMVDGYTSYSGATLVGSYQTGPTCNSISDVEPNNSTAAPQAISGTCNQISGTFLNDATSQQNDFFRLSLPAGRTVTALLNGLTVDYDLEIYDAAGNWVAYSYNGGTNPDQASWTNTGTSAVNVYILVYRASSTRTTYQLRVSY